jgi:hypothetical protein
MSHSATYHHAAAEDHSTGLTAETVVPELGDELVRTLGLLYRAPRGIPELTIASLDFGSRTTLEAYRLFTSKQRDDSTLEVTITPLGRDVIKRCSANMPTLESSELAAAIEDAEDLLSLASDTSVRAVQA